MKNYKNNSVQQEFVKNRILAASDYCLRNQLKLHYTRLYINGLCINLYINLYI